MNLRKKKKSSDTGRHPAARRGKPRHVPSKPASARARKSAGARRIRKAPAKKISGAAVIDRRAKRTPVAPPPPRVRRKKGGSGLKAAKSGLRARVAPRKTAAPARDLKARVPRRTHHFPAQPSFLVATPAAVPRPQPTGKSLASDTAAIPQLYDTTQLILMPQAPHTIHAYWDFSRGDLDKIKSKLGDRFAKAAYILRMHEVTDAASSGRKPRRAFDISVGPEARSWYINLSADHVSYRADIGVRTAAGRFYPVAHSNVITTPRAGVSGRSEVMWLEVREKGRRQPLVLTLRARSPAAAPAPDTMRQFAGADAHPSMLPRTPAAPSDMAAAIDGREETARLAGAAAPATAIETPRSAPHEAGMTPAADVPRVRAKGDGQTAVVSHGPLNLTLDEIVMRLFGAGGPARTAAAGDPAAAPAPSACSPMPPSTSWGGASEWSAGGSEQRLGQKGGFFFEIDAELLVYGRTEPDAQVLLNNEPVLLRPDGSFSLRFALPDGTVPLDFSALSARGDARRISTAVVRAPTQRES